MLGPLRPFRYRTMPQAGSGRPHAGLDRRGPAGDVTRRYAVQHEIRRVPSHDTAAAAQLLYDFNREYDDPTPPPDVLAARLAEVVAGGETALFVGGEGPDGVLVVRFRPDLWSQGLEAYVAELYVRPRSEEHTSELQSRGHLVCRLLLEKKKNKIAYQAKQTKYQSES